MKILTRRQSIEQLLKNEEYLDDLVCPYCGDIFHRIEINGIEYFRCNNPYCEFNKVKITDVERID